MTDACIMTMTNTPQEISSTDIDDAIARILSSNGNMTDREYRKWNTVLLNDIRKQQRKIESKITEYSPRLDKLEKNNIILWIRKSFKNILWFILISSGYFTFVHDINPWIFNHIKYVVGKFAGLF